MLFLYVFPLPIGSALTVREWRISHRRAVSLTELGGSGSGSWNAVMIFKGLLLHVAALTAVVGGSRLKLYQRTPFYTYLILTLMQRDLQLYLNEPN